MLNTTFLDILRKLDKAELKRFEAFLSSPYFNTKANVVNIFQLIKKCAPEFNQEKLAKEELWKKLFPGKEYNYGIMKNIIYDITKCAEKFLQVEQLESDNKQQTLNLLDKLSEKHIDNIFLSKYNSYEKNFIKSSKYYHNIYEDYLAVLLRRFDLGAYNPRQRIKFFSNELGEYLIFNFITKISHNFNNIYIDETEYNEIPENNFVKIFSKVIFSNEELEKYFEKMSKGSDRNYKIANVFFKLVKCYLNPESIDYFFDFKKTLIENDKYISESGMRELYACLGSAMDNCSDVSRINKISELFEIINLLVEKNIFISEDGKVQATLYMLSVKTSSYLKKPEFIEKLMKEFLHKTDPELHSNLSLYSNAYLHYSKNEFEKSLDYINKINIDSFQMKYHLKNLHVMISYETNDYNMFSYILDTHKHFLSKNKSVSESYKESNMKFLNYVNGLFKLRETKNKPEILFTEKNLIEDVVVNKHWLIEKVKELM